MKPGAGSCFCSPMWVTETQTLRLCYATIPRSLSVRWVGSQVPRHHKWWMLALQVVALPATWQPWPLISSDFVYIFKAVSNQHFLKKDIGMILSFFLSMSQFLDFSLKDAMTLHILWEPIVLCSSHSYMYYKVVLRISEPVEESSSNFPVHNYFPYWNVLFIQKGKRCYSY